MKLLGKIIGALIAFVLIVVLAFVFLVDPNRFKPDIESLAAKQGIALDMQGDLGWSFWPSIGVTAEAVSVAAISTPDQPIAQVQKASLLLKLIPLFSGDFQIDHVLLDGAKINLTVDENGQGNWEALTQSQAPTPTPAPETGEPTAIKLEVDRISIRNTALDYSDAQSGQRISVQDLQLAMTGVNTQSRLFPLDLSLALTMDQPDSEPLALAIKLSNQLAVDEEISNIKLEDGKLELELEAQSSAKLALTYSMTLTDVQENLAYQGQIRLSETNARSLLAALGTQLDTANKSALSQLSASAKVDGTAQRLALNDIVLQLDSTRFTGNLAVTDFATSALKLALSGDTINVDDYLPAPTPTPAAPTPTPPPGEDIPLPLDTLRGLDVDAQITLDSMRVSNMTLGDIDLTVKAKNGVIKQKLSANAYQGKVKFNSATDARGDAAVVTFDGNVNDFELAPLLDDLKVEGKFDLSGAIEAKTEGTMQGVSVNQLMDSMNSTTSFSGEQVRLLPLNIEEQFCKLVNLVTQNPAEVTWDDFTEMRKLEGNIVWRDQVITLNRFHAGVAQLLMTSTGQIDLAADKYEFKLPLKLTDASAAAEMKGCSLGAAGYWLDRSLSLLRCKGSLDGLDPLKDCGFDSSALRELSKDFAEFKLRQKHGAKIDAAEQKIDDKKEELKQIKEEKKQEALDKLQDKFFKSRKPEPTPTATATPAQ